MKKIFFPLFILMSFVSSCSHKETGKTRELSDKDVCKIEFWTREEAKRGVLLIDVRIFNPTDNPLVIPDWNVIQASTNFSCRLYSMKGVFDLTPEIIPTNVSSGKKTKTIAPKKALRRRISFETFFWNDGKYEKIKSGEYEINIGIKQLGIWATRKKIKFLQEEVKTGGGKGSSYDDDVFPPNPYSNDEALKELFEGTSFLQ
jgi:hypothetical protein